MRAVCGLALTLGPSPAGRGMCAGLALGRFVWGKAMLCCLRLNQPNFMLA